MLLTPFHYRSSTARGTRNQPRLFRWSTDELRDSPPRSFDSDKLPIGTDSSCPDIPKYSEEVALESASTACEPTSLKRKSTEDDHNDVCVCLDSLITLYFPSFVISYADRLHSLRHHHQISGAGLRPLRAIVTRSVFIYR